MTGYILPKDLEDFWYMNSMADASRAQSQARFFDVPFPYTSALFLSLEAKMDAKREIAEGSGRVLGGGVCSEEKLVENIKTNLPESYEYEYSSGDWICFEKGFLVTSYSYSTGLIDYSSVKKIEVLKKGIKFIFSVTAFDAITRIHLRDHREKFIDIQCNAMGMSAFLQIMNACI